MKQLIVFLTLITSITTFGSPADPDCDCTPPGLPDQSELRDVEKISTDLITDPISIDLTRLMCNALSSSKLSRDKLESILLNKSGVQKSDEGYKLKLAIFWNKYNKDIICKSPTGKYPDQHFYKRVIQMKLDDIVLTNYFLEDEVGFPIDINAVHTDIYGKSTVLDFINRILQDPILIKNYNKTGLVDLKDTLVDFYGAVGAKP